MSAIYVPIACFVAGLAAGWLWREAWELITERDTPMRLLSRVKRGRYTLLVAALIASMILTAGVGLAVIVNDNGRDRLIRCLTEYNELSGQARDARTSAAEPAQDAELAYVREDLAYQRGLIRSLRDDTDLDQLLTTIRTREQASLTYRDRLTKAREVRVETAYPPPDLCEDYRP